MVEFRIDVVVDPRRVGPGTRRVEQQLKRVENRADSLRRSLGNLFTFVGLGIAVRQITKLADSFTILQNRIRVVTNSTAELEAVTTELFEASNATRSSFLSTATVYARLALSAKDLGKSQQELIDFTKSLNQAVILSGATAIEARNAIIQLSQGIASGALRGDELRSVLEQLPFVARLISEEIGITIGELREFGAQGKISSEIVFNALKNAGEELERQFATTVPTIGQAFQVLNNRTLEFVGNADKVNGITKTLARTIITLSENLEQFARAALAAGIALAVNFAGRGINAALAGLRALSIALLTNPLTLIPAIIAIAVGALVGFGDQVRISSDGLATISDVAIETFNTVSAAVKQAGDVLSSFADGLGIDFEFSFKGILEFAASTADAIVGFFKGSFEAVGVAFDGIAEDANFAGELILKAFRDSLEAVLDLVLAVVQSVGTVLRETFTSLRSIAKGAESFGAVTIGNIGGLIDEIAGKTEEATGSMEDIIVRIPDAFRRAQEKLAATDLLPEVELSVGAQNLGSRVGLAFRQGFADTAGAQTLLAGIFERAEQRAAERAERQKREREEREEARRRLSEGGGAGEAGEEGRAFAEFNVKAVEGLLKRVQLTQNIIEQQEILKQKFREGQIDVQTFTEAFEQLELKALEASNTLEAGFSRAFIKLRQEAEDLASVAEGIVNVFADEATEAIVNFAKTGELNFRQFANSILDEITKIIVRLLVVQAISALIPGGGGAGAALAGIAGEPLGLQHGGTTQPGRSFIVGEEGPELFTPNRTGTVTPNAATVAQEPPVVNVQVVNVDDPKMVPAAISEGRADEAILNVLARNKERVNQVIR